MGASQEEGATTRMNEMAEFGVSIEQLKDAIVANDQQEALRLVDKVDELAAALIRMVNQTWNENCRWK